MDNKQNTIIENQSNEKRTYITIAVIISSAIIITGIVILISFLPKSSSNESSYNSYSSNSSTNSDEKIEQKKKEVTVIDFSAMPKDEIETWCTNNNLKYHFSTSYSDTVPYDGFVSQSYSVGTVLEEGDTITITYSLGKKPTVGQTNALRKAESYSDNLHMSKAGIYDQLTSEYGEGFTAEEAQYAIEHIVADWNANALEKAKSYQNNLHMSKSAIYDQLTSEYGEQFTAEEAQYAIDNLPD